MYILPAASETGSLPRSRWRRSEEGSRVGEAARGGPRTLFSYDRPDWPNRWQIRIRF